MHERQQLRRTAWRAARVAAALMFGIAGAFKLAGAGSMVSLFATIGCGQWFRFATGGLELFGAALLLHRRSAIMGAGLLACVATGAIFFHLAVIGGNAIPAVLLLILTVAVATVPLRASDRWLVRKD